METFETTVAIKIRVNATSPTKASIFAKQFFEYALHLLGHDDFNPLNGEAELDLTGPAATVEAKSVKQLTALDNLTQAVLTFKGLCEVYKDFGANDTEVRTHIAEIISAALDRQPFPTKFYTEENPWELYDNPGRHHATGNLTKQAVRLFNLVKPEYELTCSEIFWLGNPKN